MIRPSAPTRIAFGLASLTLGLLSAAHSLGWIPDQARAAAEGRKSLCEAVAVQACLSAQREDIASLRTIVTALQERNDAVLSAAARRATGRTLVAVGDHETHWHAPDEQHSGFDFVEVPIFKGSQRWGSIEIAFAPLSSNPLTHWFTPATQLIAGITLASFLVTRIYLGRILTHLDPSSVIPERVRATLDTLAEGVLVLDKANRIVLANRAFALAIRTTPEELQGRRVSDLNWLPGAGGDAKLVFPWEQAIADGVSQTGALLVLRVATQEQRTFVVNAMPIMGPDGRGRGALATFDDVTAIEHKNQQLEQMLEALEVSRDDVRRQNRELNLLATVDPLTGCLNRRAFFAEFEAHWQALQENDQSLSCVMVDVDHFKSINDQGGHALGDEILKTVSSMLRRQVRSGDLVGRYGGEEFCVLLPQTNLEQAFAVAEQLRIAVSSIQFNDRPVTISLGVTTTIAGALRPHDLLAQADKALYFAKAAGRNRSARWTDVPLDWNPERDKARIVSSPTSTNRDEIGPIADLAAQLEQLAETDCDMSQIVSLTTELSRLCRSSRNSDLALAHQPIDPM